MQSVALTSRVERLVAGGRVVLSTVSLAAVYLDPAEPSRFVWLTYTLLALYCAYAVVVAVVTWPQFTQPLLWKVASHVIDLVCFSILVYLTEGPSSPFFLFFVFALFSAMLRLQRPGIIGTAVSAVIVFIGMGVYASLILHDPSFELNRFIVRSVYLLVIATLLLHFARYEENVRRELAAVVEWPRTVPKSIERLVGESIERASALLRVRRVLLAWVADEVPHLYLGTAGPQGVEVAEQVSDLAEPLLASAVTREALVIRSGRRPETLQRAGRMRFVRTDVDSGVGDLTTAFGFEYALMTRFQDRGVRGAMLFLDRADVTLEDVALAEIAAKIVAVRLSDFYESARVESVAVTTERMRLGRDLHDSLLQSLTGAGLQLQLLHREIERDPAAARDRIAELQEIVASQQRELRTFVQQLQREPAASTDIDLIERLASLGARFRRQWDLDVAVEADPMLQLLTTTVKHEVYSIVNEAVSNAAKHAAARSVTVSLRVALHEIIIAVADDGHGFPFSGEYDLSALTSLRRGPVTLKERIASLGGDLLIHSTASGARLRITIPLVGSGVAHGHQNHPR